MTSPTGIKLIEEQFRNALALTIPSAPPSWLIRWANEGWPFGTPLSPETNSPIDPNDPSASPLPFVEAEVIAGMATSAVGGGRLFSDPPVPTQSERIGLFRVYLVVPTYSGRDEINDRADAVAQAFKKATIFIDSDTGRHLYTIEPRIDDNAAEASVQTRVRIDATVPAPWHGARYVRQVSIPWIFLYYS